MVRCWWIVQRCVISQQDHLGTLQSHNPVTLRPSPVVADAHAENAAEGAPDLKPRIALVEIALFQMLEAPPWLVFAMPRQMDFAILTENGARLIDQNWRVVAFYLAIFAAKLGVTQIESEPEPARFVENGPGISVSKYRSISA